MQNLINEVPQKKNYDFIDAIRGIAMMSIVFEHCYGVQKLPIYSASFWVSITIFQLAKFGTIIFFLLAGFLIGDKFTDYTPAQYLKRRFANTFGPWMFWSLLYVFFAIITLYITNGIYHDGRFNLHNILSEVKTVYLYSNYWFIINFMVSISLLLIFKRYLYSYFFGAVLLSFTLFYNVNIHFEWIDPTHTVAILGFIFFLWLGAQMRKHWAQIEVWIRKTSYIWLLVGFVTSFAFSCAETIRLLNSHSIDPYNTLRFSNVLFSIFSFLLLLKIRKFGFITLIKPRVTTYGIYLIHYLLLSFLIPQLFIHLPFDVNQLGIIGSLAFKLMTFIVVYFLTLLLVLAISRSRLKALVGN